MNPATSGEEIEALLRLVVEQGRQLEAAALKSRVAEP
jgi:hypothetical protein